MDIATEHAPLTPDPTPPVSTEPDVAPTEAEPPAAAEPEEVQAGPPPREPRDRPATPSPGEPEPRQAPPTEPEAAPEGVGLVDQLLRDRSSLLERIQRGEGLTRIARVMLVTIVLSAAVFGAAVGFYRGGAQVAFGALKLPMAVLLTAALCAPAFSALQAAIGGEAKLRQDLSVMLSSLALGSLIIAACAPLILLAIMFDVGYHKLILLTVACCAAGGAGGLSLFVRGVRGPTLPRRLVIGGALLVIVALVGSQMSWTLRPWFVRPRTPEPPIVRQLEGSFLEAVAVSARSSLGIYRSDYAPLPGERQPSHTWDAAPTPAERRVDPHPNVRGPLEPGQRHGVIDRGGERIYYSVDPTDARAVEAEIDNRRR